MGIFDRKKQDRERKKQERALAESGILFVTTVEVLCQTHGIPFHLTSHKPHQSFTCHRCGKERFDLTQGTGRGNVFIDYIGADNSKRRLEKVIPINDKHATLALAQMTATGGTFILVSQEKP